ncbi:hypothetical protein AMTRI_Chr08g206810 [Amborella trichopoda]
MVSGQGSPYFVSQAFVSSFLIGEALHLIGEAVKLNLIATLCVTAAAPSLILLNLVLEISVTAFQYQHRLFVALRRVKLEHKTHGLKARHSGDQLITLLDKLRSLFTKTLKFR